MLHFCVYKCTMMYQKSIVFSAQARTSPLHKPPKLFFRYTILHTGSYSHSDAVSHMCQPHSPQDPVSTHYSLCFPTQACGLERVGVKRCAVLENYAMYKHMSFLLSRSSADINFQERDSSFRATCCLLAPVTA
jgi:hypothetical protein